MSTLLDRDMPLYQEEIFGPVAPITPFADDEEAIFLANDTEYGLTGAIHSSSPGRALAIAERIHAGMVHINDTTIKDAAHVPFGGLGISGNGGSFGGTGNWEAFTHWQWITMRQKPLPTPY